MAKQGMKLAPALALVRKHRHVYPVFNLFLALLQVERRLFGSDASIPKGACRT